MITTSIWARRSKAVSIHLAISIAIAAIVWICAMFLLFPGDYALLAGGQKLFWLIVSIDAIAGPLLTAVVFNPTKRLQQLKCDLLVIASIQMIALAYGIYVLYLARPVALVFEVDRFRVISQSAVLLRELPEAPPQYRSLPIGETWVLGARATSDPGTERLQAIELAIDGYDLGQRPRYWQPYENSMAAALSRSQPVSLLLQHSPATRAEIELRLIELNLDAKTAKFLPLTARIPDWVVLLHPSGAVAGFSPGITY